MRIRARRPSSLARRMDVDVDRATRTTAVNPAGKCKTHGHGTRGPPQHGRSHARGHQREGQPYPALEEASALALSAEGSHHARDPGYGGVLQSGEE